MGQLELSHFFLNIFSLEFLRFVLWSKLKIKGKTLNFWHCSHADSSLVVPGEMFCFPSVKQVRGFLPLLGEMVWESASVCEVF